MFESSHLWFTIIWISGVWWSNISKYEQPIPAIIEQQCLGYMRSACVKLIHTIYTHAHSHADAIASKLVCRLRIFENLFNVRSFPCTACGMRQQILSYELSHVSKSTRTDDCMRAHIHTHIHTNSHIWDADRADAWNNVSNMMRD